MSIIQDSYTFGRSFLTPEARRKPLRTYLVGGSISASRSPAILSALFTGDKLPWTFNLLQTTNKDKFLEILHDESTIGVSITMPNKIAFMPLLDGLTEQARDIGAVNTAFVRVDGQRRRRYIGANTDCIGIRNTLDSVPGAASAARGKPALVIGSGGAARSAIYALWKYFNPSEIYVVNRIKSEVDDLITGMKDTIPGIKLRHIQTAEDEAAAAAPTIVVGTIPDYPPKTEDELLVWKICESFLRRVGTARGVLLDMCYMPEPWTRLCRLASESGCKILLGSEVLVRVCAAQHDLWTEKEPDPTALKDVLYKMQNVGSPKAKI